MPASIAKKTEEEMAAKAAGEEAKEENEREEENSRKLGSSATATEDEEELPGSPSFRFYFVAAAKDSDEDSLKAGIVEKDEKLKEKKTEHTHEREASNESLTSGEESDFKPSEKKGKRFRALTKAPTVVYSLLNVRNCYCNNPVDVGVVRENQLLTGKAA